MKKIVCIAITILCAWHAHPQGTVTFVNRGGATTSAAPGQVLAPIYREDPNDATHRISGNTPAGVPSGTTSYNGAPVVTAGQQDHTWTATLWGRLSTEVAGDAFNNNLLLLANGVTTFRTNTSGILAGIVSQPLSPAPVPGVRLPGDRGTFQVRVWDTRNGTINTWEDVWLPLNDNVLRGYSEIFTVPWALGELDLLGPVPPLLQGLESFNVFIVPEPSVIVLSVVGGALLVVFRRKQR